LIQRVTGQLQAQLVDDPAKSPFYKPFAKFPDAVPPAERAALQAEAQQVIRERIVPAYRRFAAFFADDYLPRTRESIAAADLPDGTTYYVFLARYFTNTYFSANACLPIGLKEVARIRAEMEQIKAEVRFQGTLQQFFEHLRIDPKFFCKTPEELLSA